MRIKTPSFNTIFYTSLLVLAGALIYAYWQVERNEQRIEQLEDISTFLHTIDTVPKAE